ncbi:MAG: glycosyltransferase family 39 protein [Candidatus Krumholzibacteriaceae bacterium]|jgi:uncharacterized membrane protein
MRYKGGMRDVDASRSGRFVLCAIVALALFLRFFRLAHQSLWVDEILSYKAFTSPAGIPYWQKFLYDVHGPLYSLIMHFWSMVSKSDLWLRAPSAIAGVLAVYALYRWFIVIGRSDLALPAALFMALNPFHLYYSQELRFYALLSLLSILTLIAFEGFRARPTTRTGAVLGIALALACLVHFSALFLGAAFFVYLALTGKLRGDHLRFGAVAAGVALLVIAPWIYREITVLRQIHVVGISTLSSSERLRGDLTLSRWSYPYSIYAFSAGYSLGPSLRELHLGSPVFALIARHAAALVPTLVVFGGLLISGIIRSARTGRLWFFLSVILVSIGSVTLITAFNVKVFNVRYLMCAFPLYVALVVHGLPSGRAARILVAAAACGLMIVSDVNYQFNAEYAREDVRGAAAIVTGGEAKGDIVLAPGVEEVFAHYYKGSNATPFIEPARLGEKGVDAAIAGYFASHARIWHLRSRNWDRDPEDILAGALLRRGAPVGSWKLAGVVLTLYGERASAGPSR